MEKKDYYEILEIPRTANDEEIKKQYKKLALKYHPDKNMGDGDSAKQKDAGEMFKLVNSAFQVLSNKEAKEVYDKYGEDGLQGLANNNKEKCPKKSSEVSVPVPGGKKDNVDFTFQTATEETCFEERVEKDGVSYIRTGGTRMTQSIFTYVYTGDEDPMETFARVFGTNDIFSLLLNLNENNGDPALSGVQPLGLTAGNADADVTSKQAVNCAKCELPILGGTSVKFNDKLFHDGCFKCENCSGKLQQSVYTAEEKQYCEDCHVKLFAKKCDFCSKPLKGGCTVFRDKNYHSDCLCCSACKKPFEKMTVMMKDDKLFCESCYQEKHGKVCVACSNQISPVKDCEAIQFNEKSYHKNCFVCSKCKLGLPTVKPIFTTEKSSNAEDHYCCECFDTLFSEKCTACKEIISVADISGCVGSGDQQWHKPCFKCSTCDKSLIGQPVSLLGEKVLCSAKCNKVKE